jgi:hypothetical protein
MVLYNGLQPGGMLHPQDPHYRDFCYNGKRWVRFVILALVDMKLTVSGM